jgi:hypothetical protein
MTVYSGLIVELVVVGTGVYLSRWKLPLEIRVIINDDSRSMQDFMDYLSIQGNTTNDTYFDFGNGNDDITDLLSSSTLNISINGKLIREDQMNQSIGQVFGNHRNFRISAKQIGGNISLNVRGGLLG